MLGNMPCMDHVLIVVCSLEELPLDNMMGQDNYDIGINFNNLPNPSYTDVCSFTSLFNYSYVHFPHSYFFNNIDMNLMTDECARKDNYEDWDGYPTTAVFGQ